MHSFSGGDKIWGEKSFDESSPWKRGHMWSQVTVMSPQKSETIPTKTDSQNYFSNSLPPSRECHKYASCVMAFEGAEDVASCRFSKSFICCKKKWEFEQSALKLTWRSTYQMPRWLPWWWRGFLSAWRTRTRPSKALLMKNLMHWFPFLKCQIFIAVKKPEHVDCRSETSVFACGEHAQCVYQVNPTVFHFTINDIILIVICHRRVVIFRANAILDTKATLHSFSVVGMKNTRWRPGNSADDYVWILKLVLKYIDAKTWNREDIQPTILEGHFGTTQLHNLGSVSLLFLNSKVLQITC